MSEKKDNDILQAILDNAVDNKNIFGTSFAVKKDGQTWFGSSGNMTIAQPYFIASTTKLFTTAIIMHLKHEYKLSLDDKICNYLDDKIVNGLHLYKGKEYSNDLTIKHLLAHTSGLPDYFQDKGVSGKSLETQIIKEGDHHWTFEEIITKTKTMTPIFPPNTKRRAHYSDANFQLLGKIIEIITEKSYSENCVDLIIKPLGLTKTYLYQDESDKTPKPLYYRSHELHRPKAMTSFTADGGMVSTSPDMLVFIEAFFTGKLFPSSYINSLKEWNNIFFPLQSGVGIHKFQLPWIFDPTGKIPSFIGHSGLSGALAFHSHEKNLFVAGTVNQVARPDLSFKTMIKLIQKC